MMSSSKFPTLFEEAVIRKVLYISLTFVISFAVMYFVAGFRQKTISSYQHQIENQQSRSSLGKTILNRLLMIELEFKQMVDTKDARTVDILYGAISDNIEDISRVLDILHNGGVFINSLPANYYEFNYIEEKIPFKRDVDEGYVIEVIELTPKMIDLGECAEYIAVKMKKRLEPGLDADHNKLSDQLNFKYMKVEALILRARESASKVFYDTQREIQSLTELKEKAVSQINIVIFSLLGLTLLIGSVLCYRIVLSIRGILNDREQNSLNLSEAKQTIEIILDSIPVGVIIVNENKEVVRANTEALRLFEADDDSQVLNKKCNNIFCLASNEICPFENDIGLNHVTEVQVNTFRGRKVTVLKNATYITFSGERLILEAFMDITRRKEMEKKLEEQRRYINAVLQGVQAGVVVVDAANHTIADMNEAAARLIGIDREKALGASCHRYICPAEEGRCPLVDLGQTVDHAVRTLPNGKSVLKSVVPFHRGDHLYLLESFVDITERVNVEKKLKKALEEADKASLAKSEFLSRMSHELRTPLNAIIGFSDLLLDDRDPVLTGKQSSQVEHIKVSGLHLMQMITKVLDFSKIESGKMIVNIEPVSVLEVVQECLVILGSTADSNKINISVDIGVGLIPPVRADRTHLKQVLLNLISNAVKYNKPGGSVTISADAAGDGISLQVSDTGIGISTKIEGDIFSPFIRLVDDNSNIEGTGIGMAITKQLVEFMNGSISFESSEGIGTTFTVYLPTYAEAFKYITMDEFGESQEDAVHGNTLVYAGINREHIDSFHAVVDNIAGYSLLVRRSVEKAVKAVELMKADVLFVHEDILSAGVAEDFAAVYGRVPIVVVRSHFDGDISSDGVPCLKMPFDQDELIAVVNNLKDKMHD